MKVGVSLECVEVGWALLCEEPEIFLKVGFFAACVVACVERGVARSFVAFRGK